MNFMIVIVYFRLPYNQKVAFKGIVLTKSSVLKL